MKNSRLSLAVVLVSFLGFGNYANASFPVETTKSEVVEEQTAAAVTVDDVTKTDEGALLLVEPKIVSENNLSSPAATNGGDNMIVAILLWFFLGGFAAHRWYAGKPVGWNILFILTFGGLGIWWLIDGIMILTGSFFD